jgi:hypothetical protein
VQPRKDKWMSACLIAIFAILALVFALMFFGPTTIEQAIAVKWLARILLALTILGALRGFYLRRTGRLS